MLNVFTMISQFLMSIFVLLFSRGFKSSKFSLSIQGMNFLVLIGDTSLINITDFLHVILASIKLYFVKIECAPQFQ